MRYALVTGANKGIGYAVAQQLLAAGYFVFLGCRDAARGHRAQRRLHAAGWPHSLAVVLDVTDDRSVLRAIEVVYQHAPRLEILINNAGIPSADLTQSPSTIPLHALQPVFDTNYYGVIRTMQAFLPLLQVAAHACIVNVSSSLGSLTRQADPTWKHYDVKPVAYVTSKAMLNAWTVLLAHELRATTIKVNAVNPGHAATDFTNQQGTHSAAHAAQVIVHYATLPPNGPTGQFFSEDGPEPW